MFLNPLSMQITSLENFSIAKIEKKLPARSNSKIPDASKSTIEKLKKTFTLPNTILGAFWTGYAVKNIAPGPTEMLKTSPITNALLGTCLAAHTVKILYPKIVEHGSFHLPKILEGEVWRLATGPILHANLLHLFLNMFALYNNGPKIEKNWGASGFAQIAVMATVANVIGASVISPNRKSIGLSGVLYGMKGALLAHSLKGNTADFGNIFGEFMVSEYIIAKIYEKTLGMKLDMVAHVAGFVAGMAFGTMK